MMTLPVILLLDEYDIDFYLNWKSSSFLLSISVQEEMKKVADYKSNEVLFMQLYENFVKWENLD